MAVFARVIWCVKHQNLSPKKPIDKAITNMTAKNNKTAIKGGLLPQEHYAKRNGQGGVLRRSGYQSGSGVLPSS